MLVGVWEPKGIAFGGKLYRLDDLEGLDGLYNGIILTVNPDETFTILDGSFLTKGNWTASWMEGTDHAYSLMSQSVARLVFDNGQFETVSEQAKDTCYRMWQPGDDPDTMAFSDPDSDDIFYYVRSGAEGRYLDENCAELPASVKS